MTKKRNTTCAPAATDEKGLARFYSLSLLNPNPVVEVDVGGVMIWYNRAAAEVLKHLSPGKDGTAFCPDDMEKILTAFKVKKKDLHFQREKEIENRIFKEDIYCSAEFHSVRIYAVDITEGRYTQRLLRERETKYRALYENANDAIFLMEGDVLVDCNRKTEGMFGRAREEILGQTPYWLSPPMQPDGRDSKEKAREKLNAAVKGEPQFFEWKHLKKDGTLFDAEVSLNRIDLDSAVFVQAIVRDTTARKSAEEALKISEKRYRELIDNTLVGVCQTTLRGDVRYVNEAFLKLSEYQASEEILSKSIRFLCKDVLKGRLWREELNRTGKIGDVELELVTKTGKIKSVLMSASLHGDTLTAMVMDFTERKSVEEALRDSEATARALLNATTDAAYLMDTEGTILTLNTTLAERFGKTAEELTGANIHNLLPEDVAVSRKRLLGELINTRKPVRFEYERKRMWFENSIYPILDAESKVAKLAVFSRDVTEQRRSARALKESEERYRTAIEYSNDGVAIVKGDMHVYVNQKFVEMFGYESPEDIAGKPLLMVVHPDDHEKVLDIARKRQRGEDAPSRYIFKGITQSGVQIYVEVSAAIITYMGEASALVYMRDITERKKMEDMLWLTQFSIDHAVDTHFWIWPDGRFAYVSETSCKKLGYSREELLSMSLRDIDVEYSAEMASSVWKNIRARGSFTFRSHHRARDGTIFPVEVTSHYLEIHGQQYIFSYARDITEQEKQEMLLQTEREKFRILLEYAPFGMAMIDGKGNYTYLNRKFVELFGYTLDEIWDGKVWFSKVFPDPVYRQQAISAWIADATLIEEGERIPRIFTVVTKGGAKKIINIIAVALKTGDYLVSYEDVTEKKKAEEDLLNETERLTVTLRSIGDGVIATDIEGRVVLLNAVAEELTGWAQEEAVGRDIRHVFHIVNEKTGKVCENPVENVLKAGTPAGLANNTLLIARDGRERVIADSGAPILGKDGNIIGVVLVFRDVTEKRKINEELQKMSKLESVGVLAGGIAHDFNNILAAILGNISLARMYVKPEEERVQKRLFDAEQAILRARDLTQQLLTFSKGGAPIKRTASIGNILVDSASFAVTGSNVRCEFELCEQLLPVDIDEGQMSQVIHSLSVNAQQAMPQGGVVRVGAENVIVDKARIEHGALLKRGKYVRISVTDKGVGIPAEHINKVFDPYFTTKQKGSGLGLATSYSIVKKHDGFITVESTLGVGTTFYVCLPASIRDVPDYHAHGEGLGSGGLKGRVLLVDDEEIILNTTSEILEALGYETECAKDGEEALEIYRTTQTTDKPYDVVILDLTIPGRMGGKVAIQRLLAIDPDVNAIVSSGYSNDPVMADFRKYGFSGVITKPYKIEDLSKTLAAVITEKAKAARSSRSVTEANKKKRPQKK